jgi:acetyl-CoA acetyltransferase
VPPVPSEPRKPSTSYNDPAGYVLATMCIGGNQAIAAIFERI